MFKIMGESWKISQRDRYLVDKGLLQAFQTSRVRY